VLWIGLYRGLMEILDVNGKKISNGLRVKYIRTHTRGKVTNILIKGDIAWIKLDSNGLYYRSEYIEVVEDNKTYIKLNKKEKGLKSGKFKVRSPTEISDPEDGPGYGGG
jgi:hypothetical protein